MVKVIVTALLWFFNAIGIKVLIVGAMFAVLSYVVPIAWGYVAPFIGLSGLTSMFNALPLGIYWALYALKFDVGIPLIISAYVSRFLIRRLPFIG